MSYFLFDDREDFFFGEVTCEEIHFVEMAKVLRKAQSSIRTTIMQTTFVAIAALSAGFLYNMGVFGSSPAHAHVKTHASSTDMEVGDELRQQFVENRKFLGLKQNQVASILGLSVSTIEKFEQEIYATQTLKTKEAVKLFNEWVIVLRDSHGDRPFIVRPFLTVKMNSLDGMTPIEYASRYPSMGLRHLISLEKLING